MTPKEKAAEITSKYFNFFDRIITVNAAKQCALIAVDEIINTKDIGGLGWRYWQQVKQQIENL